MKTCYALAVLASWVLLLPREVQAQSAANTVTLKRAKLTSAVSGVTRDVADHALRIASFILNAKEFQDSVKKRSYDYNTICPSFRTNRTASPPAVRGQQVIDSLLRKPTATLELRMRQRGRKPRKNNCYALGSTSGNSDLVFSNYENIMCDMGDDFPFAYAYAVHLCHEYTHDVGYCHTDNSQERDTAESVGWIAFHFMKKWYDAGTRVP